MNAPLEAMAQRLRAESRADIQASAERVSTELRSDIRTSADQLRADIQASANRLTEDAAEREGRLREEMRDGQRHLGVLIESLRSDIQVVAEGVVLLNAKFDRLAVSEDRTRSRVDGLELRVLALEQAERERRRPS